MFATDTINNGPGMATGPYVVMLILAGISLFALFVAPRKRWGIILGVLAVVTFWIWIIAGDTTLTSPMWDRIGAGLFATLIYAAMAVVSRHTSKRTCQFDDRAFARSKR